MIIVGRYMAMKSIGEAGDTKRNGVLGRNINQEKYQQVRVA